MKTSMTKTELAELVSSMQKDINHLKEENSIKSRDLNDLRAERDELYEQIRQDKSRMTLLESKLAKIRRKLGEEETKRHQKLLMNFSAVYQIMDDIVWYGWNFQYWNEHFIDATWKDDPTLVKHLHEKFMARIQNDKNGFFTFLADLDEGNRYKLYKHIIKTYSKKGLPRHTDEV